MSLQCGQQHFHCGLCTKYDSSWVRRLVTNTQKFQIKKQIYVVAEYFLCSILKCHPFSLKLDLFNANYKSAHISVPMFHQTLLITHYHQKQLSATFETQHPCLNIPLLPIVYFGQPNPSGQVSGGGGIMVSLLALDPPWLLFPEIWMWQVPFEPCSWWHGLGGVEGAPAWQKKYKGQWADGKLRLEVLHLQFLQFCDAHN